jgi:hypothetical protein
LAAVTAAILKTSDDVFVAIPKRTATGVFSKS